MFLLSLQHRKDDGAFAVQDSNGDKVLFLFEEEDDAERYKLMLQDEEIDTERTMEIIEVADDLAIKTCSMYNYKYAVITPDDLVIPTSNDKVQED
jgi:hypothetical protein|tara:strand:- start:2860 stop:3144 length:285 start_codon:yes stop_codon:yes gene_type:complete